MMRPMAVSVFAISACVALAAQVPASAPRAYGTRADPFRAAAALTDTASHRGPLCLSFQPSRSFFAAPMCRTACSRIRARIPRRRKRPSRTCLTRLGEGGDLFR